MMITAPRPKPITAILPLVENHDDMPVDGLVCNGVVLLGVEVLVAVGVLVADIIVAAVPPSVLIILPSWSKLNPLD